MDAIEGLNNPFREEPPFGPRSQGGTDTDYDAELQELLSIPGLSCEQSATDERAPVVLRAVHRAAAPDVAAYPDDRAAIMFSDYLLELRETYRSLHSPGKRPWPAFMQAAQDGALAAADCDAIFAMTGVHVVGVLAPAPGVLAPAPGVIAPATGALSAPSGRACVAIGDYLAGLPLDTPVMTSDGADTTLAAALPPVYPCVPPTLRGVALRRACHATACRTRVQGVTGFRRMTRDEQMSEVARRSAEITDYRRAKKAA